MSHTRMWIAGAVSIFISASTANADTVDNAFRLCSVFDATGLLSEPRKVSGWKQAVDVSIDTSSSGARQICSSVVSMSAQKNIHFDRGWKIRIYSPFSNGNTIATCALPN